jgi:hypothetical protein
LWLLKAEGPRSILFHRVCPKEFFTKVFLQKYFYKSIFTKVFLQKYIYKNIFTKVFFTGISDTVPCIFFYGMQHEQSRKLSPSPQLITITPMSIPNSAYLDLPIYLRRPKH